MSLDEINDLLIVWVLIPIMTLAILFTFIRIVRGPSLPDRVVALDKLSSVGVALMAAYAVTTENTVFLDVALVVVMIAFLGTIGFSYYIVRRS
ncbi:MAG: monovalent cation/H+ antiporter complex subunit F [Chloroflexota bacterium]